MEPRAALLEQLKAAQAGAKQQCFFYRGVSFEANLYDYIIQKLYIYSPAYIHDASSIGIRHRRDRNGDCVNPNGQWTWMSQLGGVYEVKAPSFYKGPTFRHKIAVC